MSHGRQLLLLLWKNWLTVKRKKILTLIEIALPSLFALVFLLIRLRIGITEYPDGRTWNPFNIASYVRGNKVAYCPVNNLTDEIIDGLIYHLGHLQLEKLPFDNEEDMELYFTDSNLLRIALGGIVFENIIADEIPVVVKYKIRFFSEHYRFSDVKTWFTHRKFPFFTMPGPRDSTWRFGGRFGSTPYYEPEDFISLQWGLDQTLIRTINKSAPVEEIALSMMRMPYPPYVHDPYVLAIQLQFPFLILISFNVIAPNIARDIIIEKEKRLKELMKMMGMENWLHWTAWFIKYFGFTFVGSALMTLFYCVPTSTGAVLNRTDPSVLFVFFLLYSIASIAFCFACSVFFKKSSQGAAATGILFFLSYIPYFFLQLRYENMNSASKWGASILQNVAMAFGSLEISRYEGTGAGLRWSNLFSPVSADESFTMGYVFVMLIVDSVIYFLIMWYFDNVLPGEFGIPKKWYFPFTRSYWCGSKSKVYDESEADIEVGDPEYFEGTEQYSNLTVGIKIRNLRKEFNNRKKKKVAVSGTTMDMYEGQITALLGHNGAGKTTTMSILTGFLPPTSGTAYINSLDIRQDIDKVRKNIGLCPQHDVLFDNLTVREHLAFFAQLKGCPRKEVENHVSEMLGLLKLEDKTNELPTSLSGGMKRKLSVGIALIYNSKTVILDEPTSGMDPEARRQMWDILQSQRHGRTMILSTHFMDEADLLGDRIAIMAEGELQCCGSSMFLKHKYGVGYHMIIVKQPNCNADDITDIVKQNVPDAKLESNISAELSYILPDKNKAGFEDLFSFLEQNKTSLGIDSFGASVTTMEEVFLKVAEAAHKNVEDQLRSRSKNKPVTSNTNGTANSPNDLHCNGTEMLGHVNPAYQEESSQLSGETSLPSERHHPLQRTWSMEEKWRLKPVFGVELEKNTGLTLSNQQFMAMVIKRSITSWRSRIVTVTQLLVPLVFTALGGIVLQTLPGSTDPPSMPLSLDDYEDQIIAYSVNFTGHERPGTPDNATLLRLAESFASVMRNTAEEVLHYTGSDLSNFYRDVGRRSIDAYNRKHLIGATIQVLPDIWSYPYRLGSIRAIFNGEGYHTVPIALNSVSNTILRFLVGQDYRIEATNHPFPLTNDTQLSEELTSSVNHGFILSINNLFGMAFLMSTFVIYVIRERSVKSKHIQYVSGVSIINYWMSTFAWDFINYCIPVILILILYAILQFEPYITGTNIGVLLLLMLLYGCAALPLTYILSFMFNVPSSGYVWCLVFNLVTGIAAVLAVFILKIPQLDTRNVGLALEWVFYVILPNFGYGNALQEIFINYEYKKQCSNITVLPLEVFCRILDETGGSSSCCASNCEEQGFCAIFQNNYLAWQSPGIGRSLTFLGIQSIVFFGLLWFFESSAMQRFRNTLSASINFKKEDQDQEPLHARVMRQLSNIEEDDDVAKERQRITNNPLSQLQMTDSLILYGLRKFYGNFLAVDQLSVGIPQGECFGLLGVNGAGKTTTFKMLTGDHNISSGDAFLDGFSVVSDVKEVQTRLGYCPQFDALLEQMTVKESLVMYARLRGVKECLIDKVVEQCISSLLLQDHKDKLASQLSGGNKRKLSTGIALIGDPPVIFLDEPTTGMDPVARRMLWDTLEAVRASGRTLVLTSHSMEECEALCTRLAIMVNGQFKCLGSTQHLKNKFGEGYTILAKVMGIDDSEVETNVQSLMTFIETTFTGTVLKDLHQGYVHYQIKSSDVSWSKIFGIMEQAKEDYKLEDYSVSQTTLEQVFINFARAQRPPREESPSCTTKCCNCCRFFCCCCCRSNKTVTELTVESTDL